MASTATYRQRREGRHEHSDASCAENEGLWSAVYIAAELSLQNEVWGQVSPVEANAELAFPRSSPHWKSWTAQEDSHANAAQINNVGVLACPHSGHWTENLVYPSNEGEEGFGRHDPSIWQPANLESWYPNSETFSDFTASDSNTDEMDSCFNVELSLLHELPQIHEGIQPTSCPRLPLAEQLLIPTSEHFQVDAPINNLDDYTSCTPATEDFSDANREAFLGNIPIEALHAPKVSRLRPQLSNSRDETPAKKLPSKIVDVPAAILCCPHPGCSSKVLFTRQCDLDKHYRLHFRKYFCRVTGCGVTRRSNHQAARTAQIGFPTIKDRDRHEKRHHPSFRCHYCMKLFSRWDNLKDHCRRRHGSESLESQAFQDTSAPTEVARLDTNQHSAFIVATRI